MAKPKRKPYGANRVRFMSRLDVIRSDLSAGHTVQAIYDRHAPTLDMTYSSFYKLVVRYADDARPKAVNLKGSDVSKSQTTDPRPTGHDGRIDPAKLRKFTHG